MASARSDDVVNELPFGFNSNADANLTHDQWQGVSILHDLLAQRKRGWARSGLASFVDEVSRSAKAAMASGLAEVRAGWTRHGPAAEAKAAREAREVEAAVKTMEWLTRQRRDRRRLGDELDAIGGEGGNATLTSKTAAESVGDISTWSGIASALTPSPQLILNVSSFFSLAATRRELGGCQPWCSIWTCNQHEECGGCGPCALPPPPPPLSPQRFNTNPFISQAGWYVHPTLRSNLIDRTLPLAESGAERAALRQMADTPSAFWVDTRAKVRGTTLDTLEGILLNSSHGTRQLCVFVLCKRRAPPTRAVSLPSSSSAVSSRPLDF